MKTKKFRVSVESEHSFQAIESQMLAGSLPPKDLLLNLRHSASEEEQTRIMKAFAHLFKVGSDDNLWLCQVMDAFLYWVAYKIDEQQLALFFDFIWSRDSCEKLTRRFVNAIIAWEKIDKGSTKELFPLVVALTSEFGVTFINKLKEDDVSPDDIADDITAFTSYLLSLSNINDSCVRLSLLRYFSILAVCEADRGLLARIMSRFGYTTLSLLFNLLGDKKTESCALEYLLENLPYLFELAAVHQPMVHETFKNYMLKEPELFASFMKKLVSKIKRQKLLSANGRDLLCSHLGALLGLAIEINKKDLVWDLLAAVEDIGSMKIRNAMIDALIAQGVGSVNFRSFLKEIAKSSCRSKHRDKIAMLRKTRKQKKGKIPVLAPTKGVGAIKQVSSIGSYPIAG